jgi:HEAT repeat protein
MLHRRFFACLLIALSASTVAQEKSAVDSPHLRENWERALSTADLAAFEGLLRSAQKAHFPTAANDVAYAVALRPTALGERERRAAELDQFRVEAALYLALAFRSKVVAIDPEALRKLAKGYMEARDWRLGSKAASVLSHIGDKRDVPVLVSAAKSDDPNRYRSAVYALRVMCSTDAVRALEALERNALPEEKRTFIRQSKDLERICAR